MEAGSGQLLQVSFLFACVLLLSLCGLHIFGGAVEAGRMAQDSASVVTLDTSAGACVRQEEPDNESDWPSGAISQ